jgi:hypothetical protein
MSRKTALIAIVAVLTIHSVQSQHLGGEVFEGNHFQVTVPPGWYGYWGDDLQEFWSEAGGEIPGLDLVFFSGQPVEATHLIEALDNPSGPVGTSLVIIAANPLQPDMLEETEEEWAADFFDELESFIAEADTGFMRLSGFKAYYGMGTVMDADFEETDTEMLTVVMRFEGKALVFQSFFPRTDMPRDPGTDLLDYMQEMVLDTLVIE